MIMKKVYLEKVLAKPYKGKEPPPNLKPCDEDLTKKRRKPGKRTDGGEAKEFPKTIRTI